MRVTRVFEHRMAKAVAAVLRTRPKNRASFREIFELVPDRVRLSRADRAESKSRPGEEKWYQIVRNLKVHHHPDFVGIAGGLRLRPAEKPRPVRNGKTRATNASASAA